MDIKNERREAPNILGHQYFSISINCNIQYMTQCQYLAAVHRYNQAGQWCHAVSQSLSTDIIATTKQQENPN